MNILCIQIQPRYNSYTMAVLHGVILIKQSFLIHHRGTWHGQLHSETRASDVERQYLSPAAEI